MSKRSRNPIIGKIEELLAGGDVSGVIILNRSLISDEAKLVDGLNKYLMSKGFYANIRGDSEEYHISLISRKP